MKKSNSLFITLFLLAIIAFSACADVSPHAADAVTSNPYGFWSGLWHGWITTFSFIGSLFSDNIAIYAIDNNGVWYDLGFVLGIGGSGSTISSVAQKRYS